MARIRLSSIAEKAASLGFEGERYLRAIERAARPSLRGYVELDDSDYVSIAREFAWLPRIRKPHAPPWPKHTQPRTPWRGLVPSGVAPNRVAIATGYTSEIADLGKFTLENKRRYALRHGHPLIFFDSSLATSRHPAWSKIRLIQKHAADFDFIFWSDSDCAFMRFDIALTSLLDPLADFQVGLDPCGICMGTFFARSSGRMKTFWSDVYDGARADHHWRNWWEQSAVMNLVGQRGERAPSDMALRLVPGYAISSLASPQGKTADDTFRSGDFAFHAAGCGDQYNRMRLIAGAANRYGVF